MGRRHQWQHRRDERWRTAIAGGWGVGFSDAIIEPQPYVLLRTTDAGARNDLYRYDGNRPFVINKKPESHRAIAPPDAGTGAATP